MRSRAWLGVLLAFGAFSALLLISTHPGGDRDSEGDWVSRADRERGRGRPDGALGDRDLTEEERVLRVARAYLLAWHEWEFEAVWELMSGPARGGWTGDDPRAAFLSEASKFAENPSAHDRVGEERPTVVIEEELARVTWPNAGLRMFLGREAGGWRAHLHTFAAGSFEMYPLADCRQVPAVVTFDLSRKDQADFDAWWERIPRLHGEGTVEPDCDGTLEGVYVRVMRLFVDRTGRVRHRGREVAPDGLLDLMFQYADTSRDFEKPYQPSMVPVALHLDREFPAGGFRELLLKLTAPEVRFERVHVAARFDNTPAERVEYDVGLDLFIDSVLPLTTLPTRAEKTTADLVLRDTEEAVFGEDLAGKLKALPEADRKKGVRLRCGPRVPTGRLVEVLHGLAQQADLRVVLDLSEEAVPETRWGLDLDGQPVSLPALTGAVKTNLTLEVWR